MKKLPLVLGAVAVVAGVIAINQKSTKSDPNRLAKSLPAETPFYCEAINLEQQFTQFEQSPEYKELAKIDLVATADAIAQLTGAPASEAQMMKGMINSSLPQVMSGVSFLRKMVGDKLEIAYLPLSMANFDKNSSEETIVKELVKLIVIRTTSSITTADIEAKLTEVKAQYKVYNKAPFTGWEFVLDKASQTSLFLVKNNNTCYLTIAPTVLATTIESKKESSAKTLATSPEFVAAEKLAVDNKNLFANLNLEKISTAVKKIMMKFDVPEQMAKATCDKFTADFTNIFLSSHQNSSRGIDIMTATSNKETHKLLQNLVAKNELSLQDICPKDSVFFNNGLHINFKDLLMRELAGTPDRDAVYGMINQ